MPINELRETLQRLTEQAAATKLPPPRRRALELQIRGVIEDLSTFLGTLDPIRQPTSVFDPSNPKIVGRFVSLAMVAQQCHPLAEIPRFYGSGVYAIYYNGPFPLYAPLRGSETPIYAGQAAPAINNARTPMEQGAKLCGRLADHRKNISKATTTLDIADFEFRSLVVQSGWGAAAEDYLIHLFRPVWNSETKLVFGWASVATPRRHALTSARLGIPCIRHAIGRRPRTRNRQSKSSGSWRSISQLILCSPDLDTVLASFIEELRQV